MQPSFKESVKAQHFCFLCVKKIMFKVLKCNEVKNLLNYWAARSAAVAERIIAC